MSINKQVAEFVDLYVGRKVMFAHEYPARIVGRTDYPWFANQVIIETDDQNMSWPRGTNAHNLVARQLWLCDDATRGYIVDIADLELIEEKNNKPLPLPG